MNNISKDKNKIEEALTRSIQSVYPSKEEAMIKFIKGEPLKFYYGIDPTGPQIHLGHTVQLLFLKRLQKLGHKVILLIGDFTAKIGDPTGKDTLRKPLSDEEVKVNMETYINQIYKILPKGSFEVVYNSTWLKSMTFDDVIKLASSFTVQQMLVRDMFQKRIKEEKPIGVHEFLYPLMQAYDSVVLEADGEVGGNDQMFNMLAGRTLEDIYLKKDKIVVTTKLLEDPSTNKKMSKSEGNLIAIMDSPDDMYGKIMSGVSDEMIPIVFELCTEKDITWVKKREEDIQAGENPINFKKELAEEIIIMYHGSEAPALAREYFENVFKNKENPEDAPTIVVNKEMEITDLLTKNKIVTSKSEAKRLVDQGGIKISGVIIKKWGDLIKISDGEILQVGPRKFFKLQIGD